MKKALLFLASTALLLVGCAKEKFAEPIDGGMTNVTFSASVDGGVATKAAADNDGKGTNVNRCIMEIYFQNQLFTRMVAAMTGSPASTTFANVPVVAGKTYTVLFWADCGASLADKYYVTDAGLKAVTVKKDAFITALQSKKNDDLDAFCSADNYTVRQSGDSYTATLKRPFAQLNVITTDVGADKTVFSEDLLPGKVSVSYKADNTINVATGAISKVGGEEDYTFTYEADVYGEWSTVTTDHKELTLSMDYILASTEEGAVDVTFKTKNGSTEVMSHSLTNLPFKRNYLTNVKGDLLTTNGSWTATIAPAWTTPAYDVPFYVASSIQEAQNYIAPESQGTVKAKAVDLTKATISQENVGDDGKIQFILKETSPADLVNFTLPSIPSNIQNCTGWKIENEPNYPTQNVGVNAPSGAKVVIDAPKSHVTVTGSSYEEIEASTGRNTLVIPQGVSVTDLKITKGAVEIHGTVTNLTVEPAQTPDGESDNLTVEPAQTPDGESDQLKTVCFRACEGLSEDVFKEIYSETEPVCNYIDPWYTYEKVGEVYNIVKRSVVAMIGKDEYKSLSDAVAAVPSGNTELVTIKVMSDVVINADALEINKNNVVLDGQGHTIAIDDTDTRLNNYLVDGTSRKYGSFRMIKVSGNDVTLKNMTLDSKNYRGASLATTCGGKNASYENIIYKGKGSGHYYGSAANEGTLTFKDCTFETCGYAIHTGAGKPDLVITDCNIHGWVSYGSSTKSATITNCHFFSATDQHNGTLATIRPYCNSTITGCTFSKEFLEKTQYTGITVRDAATVEFKGCLVDNGEIVDMANITEPDDPWIAGGVMAIDATGNATDGFSAGTFVAKQASDIKAASKHTVTPVEGKEYIFTIIGAMTPGTYSISTASQLESFADRYNDNSEAGDYILKLNPGTYETANIILVQQPGKTLTIQSADAGNKAILKTNSTEDKQAMFAICSESSYSGGAISFLNLAFDNSTLDSGKESYMFYAAGGGSGLVDGLISALRPGDQAAHRYVHDITIDGCNAVSNGVKAQFYYACSGNSGTTIKNCTFNNIGYIANGAFSHGGGREFGLKAINCKVTSSKVFINNQVADPEKTVVTYVEGCDVSAYHDYTIRIQGGHLTVKDTDFSASYTNTTMPGEAGIIVVGDADKYKSSIIDVDNQCTFSKTDSNLPDLYVGKECTVNGQAVTGKMNFSF